MFDGLRRKGFATTRWRDVPWTKKRKWFATTALTEVWILYYDIDQANVSIHSNVSQSYKIVWTFNRNWWFCWDIESLFCASIKNEWDNKLIDDWKMKESW